MFPVIPQQSIPFSYFPSNVGEVSRAFLQFSRPVVDDLVERLASEHGGDGGGCEGGFGGGTECEGSCWFGAEGEGGGCGRDEGETGGGCNRIIH